MARQKATIVQIKGSAFVGIVDPNTHMLDTPIEQHCSDWGNVAVQIASDAFVPTSEPLTPGTPKEPRIMLKELLSEVDAILNPKPRVNTSKEICGHHYTGHPKCDTMNWESPAVKAWQAERQKKSDKLIKCRHQRNGGAAC